MRLSLLLFLASSAQAFVPAGRRPSFTTLFAKQKQKARAPSKVVDYDGPTPEKTPETVPIVDPADIYGLEYDEDAHPIPHQPWRRGETRGCEDPIDAEWRTQAQDIITLAAATKGVTVVDVTWFLTTVIVTIDPDLDQVPQYQGGPEVVYESPAPPVYFNPDNPDPEVIVPEEEDEFLWERDKVAAEELEKNRVAPKEQDEDDTFDKEIQMQRDMETLPLDRETREDMAGFTDEEIGDFERSPVEKDSIKNYMVDSLKISTVAKAILDGLEQVEEELLILERHEMILTTPSEDDILDTQREFDAYRGFDVAVETQDPWDSNRVLRGKLLERNSMDVIINKKGRMVTIPLNFVKCVRMMQPNDEDEEEEDEDEDF